MDALLPALALLACPVGMGLMMFIMARGSRSGRAVSPPSAKRASQSADHPMSLEVLREEHHRLGQEIERLEAPSSDRREAAARR